MRETLPPLKWTRLPKPMQMKSLAFPVLLALGYFTSLPASATTIDTPEEVVLEQLASWISLHRLKSQSAPTTWAELEANVNMEGFNRNLQKRFQDRYAFVSGVIPMYQNFGGGSDTEAGSQILLARVMPIRESGRLYRNFIYWDNTRGRFFGARVDEEQAQKLFQRYGGTLPSKPGFDRISRGGGLAEKPEVIIITLLILESALAAVILSRSEAMSEKRE